MTFPEFWALYPRREAKRDAQKAWGKLSMLDVADIQDVLPRHVAHYVVKERVFIPLPATWLRGRRWEDELPATSRPKALGPDYASVEDWEEECQRLHHGRCSGRYQHGLLV